MSPNCRGCGPKRPNGVDRNKLNRKITIQQHTTISVDNEGIATTGWADLVTVWAFRKPLTNRWREFYQAAGENAEKMLQYEIRYRPAEDIMPDMRIVDKGKIYELKAALHDVHGDRTETWLMAQELTDG